MAARERDAKLPEDAERTPNELDQTDESQKAADIRRAGEARDAGRRRPDQAGEERAASRAADGKTPERYAG